MRIGIDALLLHGKYSGVEHCIRDSIEALLALDDDNEYVVYAPADADLSVLDSPRISVRRMPFRGRRRFLRILWQQMVLPRRIRADGIDVFHGPGYVLPLRCPAPAVATIHDVIALIRPDLATRGNVAHYRRVLPGTARVARRIIVPSERTKQDVIAKLGVDAARISVVPWGVREVFRPVTDEPALASLRQRYELPDRFFLFVGNVEPKKNIAGMAGAFADYVEQGGPPAGLVMAGATGWMPDEFFGRLDLGAAAEHMHYVGYVPHDDLPGLYTLATALLFPSLYEGFGLPPLEAMACGTPAIVSDRGSLPEVVGDAGSVVRLREFETVSENIGAVDDMPKIMRRIAEDDAYRDQLSAAGIERARQFTWRKHAETVRGVYNEVAEEVGLKS